MDDLTAEQTATVCKIAQSLTTTCMLLHAIAARCDVLKIITPALAQLGGEACAAYSMSEAVPGLECSAAAGIAPTAADVEAAAAGIAPTAADVEAAAQELYSQHRARMHAIDEERSRLKVHAVKGLLPSHLGAPGPCPYYLHRSERLCQNPSRRPVDSCRSCMSCHACVRSPQLRGTACPLTSAANPFPRGECQPMGHPQ